MGVVANSWTSRYTLGGFFGNSADIIQLFISGTAYHAVVKSKEPTMYTFIFIQNPLLSLQGVMSLVRTYAEQIGTKQSWWLYLPFLQLLSDLGGLPS